MGDWIHNLFDLNEKGEEKQKGNIMGLMGIELGSPKSEKCDYQIQNKIKCCPKNLKSSSIAQFHIDT